MLEAQRLGVVLKVGNVERGGHCDKGVGVVECTEWGVGICDLKRSSRRIL